MDIIYAEADALTFCVKFLFPLEQIEISFLISLLTVQDCAVVKLARLVYQFVPPPRHIVEFCAYCAVVAMFVPQEDNQFVLRDVKQLTQLLFEVTDLVSKSIDSDYFRGKGVRL